MYLEFYGEKKTNIIIMHRRKINVNNIMIFSKYIYDNPVGKKHIVSVLE